MFQQVLLQEIMELVHLFKVELYILEQMEEAEEVLIMVTANIIQEVEVVEEDQDSNIQVDHLDLDLKV